MLTKWDGISNNIIIPADDLSFKQSFEFLN